MIHKTRNPRRHILLLVAIFLFLAARPFSEHFQVGSWIMTVLMTGVFLTSVWSISGSRRKLWTGIALGFVTVLGFWADVLVPAHETAVPKLGLTAVFLVFMIVILLAAVLKAPRVTLDSVCGGISAYLLLGVLWADLYALADYVDERTFDISSTIWHDYIFFSFVTLTTLGYGDVVPQTDLGKTLAYLEAVVGTLFVAVLISALVAQYISHPLKADPDQEEL